MLRPIAICSLAAFLLFSCDETKDQPAEVKDQPVVAAPKIPTFNSDASYLFSSKVEDRFCITLDMKMILFGQN